MNIILIICISIVAVLYCILILLIVEVFIFEKAIQRQGINFMLNLGNIINKKEIKEILNLLESNHANYKGLNRRITIYGYRWQFIFFYLVRLSLAQMHKQEELKNEYKRIMNKDSRGALSCGVYLNKFNIIEIYAFNLKRLYKGKNMDIIKIQLVYVIVHEFRHRVQYINQLNVEDEEVDADEFTTEFLNKNKQKIKEILNLSHTITFNE